MKAHAFGSESSSEAFPDIGPPAGSHAADIAFSDTLIERDGGHVVAVRKLRTPPTSYAHTAFGVQLVTGWVGGKAMPPHNMRPGPPTFYAPGVIGSSRTSRS